MITKDGSYAYDIMNMEGIDDYTSKVDGRPGEVLTWNYCDYVGKTDGSTFAVLDSDTAETAIATEMVLPETASSIFNPNDSDSVVGISFE